MSSSSASSSDESSPTRRPESHFHAPSHNSGDEEDNTASGDSETPNPEDGSEIEPLDEEPVLSHADKRRQKKKDKQRPATDVSQSDRKSSAKSAANASNPSTVKRQHSVWVGNLAFKTTPDALRKFFDGVGEITRIHMPMKLSTRADAQDNNKRPVKENRGSAFHSVSSFLSLTCMTGCVLFSMRYWHLMTSVPSSMHMLDFLYPDLHTWISRPQIQN